MWSTPGKVSLRKPTSHDPAGARRVEEHAFTMIELLATMLIISILLVIGLLAFRSAQSDAIGREARAVAAAYDQAIASFMSDRANTFPQSTDWFVNSDGLNQGPKNLLGVPYMKGVPEGVAAGRIGVSTDGGNCGSTLADPTGAGPNQLGWISYCQGTPPQYAIRVITRRGNKTWTDSTSKICWRGNTPNTPTC